MQISALTSYPVKSCAGFAHHSVRLETTGLLGDRSWMLTGPDGRFITARRYPRMLLISPRTDDGGLLLNAPGMETAEIPIPDDTRATQVQVWRDQVTALDAGDLAAAWLSDFLAAPCRLVYAGSGMQRPVNAAAAKAGESVHFADSCPVLVIGEASLEALNLELGETLAMARFRPNIVVKDSAAYAENNWHNIRLGDIELSAAKPCSRCILTTIDPVTAATHPQREPLATLKKLRMLPGEGAVFGHLFIPKSTGTLAVGDLICPID